MILAAGPWTRAAFWNYLFKTMGWVDQWEDGEEITPEMGERAAMLLLEILRRAVR